MTLAPYRTTLRLPGVTALLVVAVLARIPHVAGGIALTLHVVLTLGHGYAAAGLVATAATLGAAVGGPWRGRAVDRFGLRRALLPSLVVESVVWSVAPFLGYRGLLVAALIGGLMGLPVFSLIRQCLAVLVPPPQRRTAFALDSIGTELSFMAGPALGVLVATQVSTRTALIGVGAATVLAGITLIVYNPPTRSTVDGADVVASSAPDAERAPRSAWFRPAFMGVLASTAAATLVLAGTDVGVIALLRDHGAVELSGLVFTAWGVGSIAGGLVYGAVHRPVPPALLLLGLGLLTIPVGLAPSPAILLLTILPAAALCAPILSATAEAVSRIVPEGSRGEAMGWHGSALTVGLAVGAPVAGVAIDAAGSWAGFAVVGALGAVLAFPGLATSWVGGRRAGRRGAMADLPDRTERRDWAGELAG